MTKGEATARIAAATIGWLSSSTMAEILGVGMDDYSEADAKRLEDAAEKVCQQLVRMGKQTT